MRGHPGALKREGYVVDAANEAPTALQMIGERLYNLVITDVKMPEMSGLELLKEARQKSRDTQFILMTAYGTVESAVAAMKEGAYDYLSKPLDMQRRRALVLKALEFQALVAENNELRLRLQKRSEPSLLVGASEAMRRVTQTRIVARTARPVTGIDELDGVYGVQLDDGELTLHVDSVAMAPVMRLLAEHDVQSLVSTPPSLEELFARHYSGVATD